MLVRTCDMPTSATCDQTQDGVKRSRHGNQGQKVAVFSEIRIPTPSLGLGMGLAPLLSQLGE